MHQTALPGYGPTVQDYPLLTKEQEQDLFRRYNGGDQDAWTTLILSNVRLVAKVATWFLRSGIPYSDLVQEGFIGLIQAMDRYQVERGHKFSTYATWWIRQTVQRAAWEYQHIVHVPVNHGTELRRVRAAWQKLSHELGREPTEAEVAVVLDIEAEEVSAILAVAMDWYSLDAPASGSTDDPAPTDFKDILPEKQNEHPLETMAREQDIARVLKSVTPRQRRVLEERYGLDDENRQGKPLREMEESFGVSRQRLHELESQALQMARRLLGPTRQAAMAG
jgi:RNA polymerase primary sigma factor